MPCPCLRAPQGGNTALDMAKESNKTECVRLLENLKLLPWLLLDDPELLRLPFAEIVRRMCIRLAVVRFWRDAAMHTWRLRSLQ